MRPLMMLLAVTALGALAALQIWLCGREKKWLGFLLPAASFLLAAAYAAVVAFSGEEAHMVLASAVMMNLPTLLFLSLLIGVRRNRGGKRRLFGPRAEREEDSLSPEEQSEGYFAGLPGMEEVRSFLPGEPEEDEQTDPPKS